MLKTEVEKKETSSANYISTTPIVANLLYYFSTSSMSMVGVIRSGYDTPHQGLVLYETRIRIFGPQIF